MSKQIGAAFRSDKFGLKHCCSGNSRARPGLGLVSEPLAWRRAASFDRRRWVFRAVLISSEAVYARRGHRRGRSVRLTSSPIQVVFLTVLNAYNNPFLSKDFHQLLPQSSFTPPIESARYGRPRTVSFRKVSPWSPGAQNPQDPVDNSAVVFARAPGTRLLGGQHQLDLLPLPSCQIPSSHRMFLPQLSVTPLYDCESLLLRINLS